MEKLKIDFIVKESEDFDQFLKVCEFIETVISLLRKIKNE